MTYELRFDAARFSKVERTPQGFVRVQANLTRVGVFAYPGAGVGGSVRREFRPAEEVFAPASLATLAAAPVTDLHPNGLVTPRNVKALRVGGVLETKADGGWISATLQIEDADAIDAVLARKRTENSLGYQCQTEETPGRWDAATGEYGPHVVGGEAYDAIQRRIVYNHSALLPTGAARAGSEAMIRLDSQSSSARDEMIARRRGISIYPRADADDVPPPRFPGYFAGRQAQAPQPSDSPIVDAALGARAAKRHLQAHSGEHCGTPAEAKAARDARNARRGGSHR